MLVFVYILSIAFCIKILVSWPMWDVNIFVYLVKLGICYISIEPFLEMDASTWLMSRGMGKQGGTLTSHSS